MNPPPANLGPYRCISGRSANLVLFLVFIFAISVSCDDPRPAPAPTTTPSITVASLVPAATRLIADMGARERLVGISNWDPERSDTAGLARVGDYRSIDWEKLSTLRPTVMIVQYAPDKMPPGLQERAAEWGIKLVNIRINTLDDLYIAIDALGAALDEKAKADAAKAKLRGQLDAVQSRVASRPPVRAFLSTGKPLNTVGGGTFLNDILTIAGGKNVIEGGENSYPTIDLERLVAADPQVVIGLASGAARQELEQTRSFWDRAPAFAAKRDGRIYQLTDDDLLLPALNLGRMAEQFADLLHPETAVTTQPAPAVTR